jgi:hypothetical protein
MPGDSTTQIEMLVLGFARLSERGHHVVGASRRHQRENGSAHGFGDEAVADDAEQDGVSVVQHVAAAVSGSEGHVEQPQRLVKLVSQLALPAQGGSGALDVRKGDARPRLFSWFLLHWLSLWFGGQNGPLSNKAF